VVNQIVLKEHTVQPGPYRVADYKSFAIGDTDITAKAASCNFGYELIDYLDRYFAGWKLIRRVVELPGSYTPYKRVTYLVEVGTDADARRSARGCGKGLSRRSPRPALNCWISEALIDHDRGAAFSRPIISPTTGKAVTSRS
jgi:hypothetical protein